MHVVSKAARLASLAFFAGAPLLFVAPAAAQEPVGIKAGVSAEPDQFYFGVQFESDPLVDQLRFRPNLEIGVGDDRTLVAVNVEFAYFIPLRARPWRVFLGGGPALNILRFNDDEASNGRGRGREADTEVGGGFNILVGLAHRDGLFTEFKVGALNSPEIKFAVGYSFGR